MFVRQDVDPGVGFRSMANELVSMYIALLDKITGLISFEVRLLARQQRVLVLEKLTTS